MAKEDQAGAGDVGVRCRCMRRSCLLACFLVLSPSSSYEVDSTAYRGNHSRANKYCTRGINMKSGKIRISRSRARRRRRSRCLLFGSAMMNKAEGIESIVWTVCTVWTWTWRGIDTHTYTTQHIMNNAIAIPQLKHAQHQPLLRCIF